MRDQQRIVHDSCEGGGASPGDYNDAVAVVVVIPLQTGLLENIPIRLQRLLQGLLEVCCLSLVAQQWCREPVAERYLA